MKRYKKLFSLIVLVVAALMVTTAAGQGGVHEVGQEGGNFVVRDAQRQFTSLKHHGEALAWQHDERNGAPDAATNAHYQGVARYPNTGEPIFYVTQSFPWAPIQAGHGFLHVVALGSRDTDGERLRSNLQVYGQDTKNTQPQSQDSWVRSLSFNSSMVIDEEPLRPYIHPGGMAIVDDILFVALDTPQTSSDAGQIILFDLRPDPKDPQPIQSLALRDGHAIDNLAVTQQEDGRYLIWTNGAGGGETHFYETNEPDLRNEDLELVYIQNWDHDSGDDYDGNGESWRGSSIFDGGATAHQASTFLREPDGTLYMVAMWRNGVGSIGNDHADLYRVDPKPTGDGFKLTRLETKHFYCEYMMADDLIGDTMICNFAAAGGGYVSPTGELMLYSVPHDDVDSWATDGVRFAEFRHRELMEEENPMRDVKSIVDESYAANEGELGLLDVDFSVLDDQPWVELFDDEDWDDRSIVVDFQDQALLELDNFNHLDGFNDKTTAIRWRLPVGMRVELFADDNFRNRHIVLVGTGRTETIRHLDSQTVRPGVVEAPGLRDGAELNFNDEISSMRFVGTAVPLTVQWDLDGDGKFGETGSTAERGDEVGAVVTFSAEGLDGPSTATVGFQITDGVNTVEDVTTINVLNVAPTADFILSSNEIINGEPFSFELDNVYDPSFADMDAGSMVALSCDGFDNPIPNPESIVCVYDVPGTYYPTGRVEDKDGGYTEYSIPLVVRSRAEAFDHLIVMTQEVNAEQLIEDGEDVKFQAAFAAQEMFGANMADAAVDALQNKFLTAVDAQAAAGAITAAQADQLSDYAQRLIASLNAMP